MMRFGRSIVALVLVAWAAGPAWAQVGAAPQPAAPQSPQLPRLPPADSPPLLRYIELRFPTQGNVSVIDPQTYQYYIQSQPSRPSDGVWMPYDEQSVLADFRRLWNTNFLDNLWVEVKDAPYPNGVIGKHVIFNMEERQRVKIVDYSGSKKIEQSKIEEKLREEAVQIRLDSFIDPGLIRRVEGVVRGMFAEKGFEFAQVTHTIQEVAGGPKLVHLTFNLDEGPKVKIRRVEFVGNKAIGAGALRRQMKTNKQENMLSFVTGRGTYQATKFEEDAEKVTEYYRDHGYVTARVGQPELKYVEDSTDLKTRYIQLRIPVQEGERYRVGTFSFDGNTVIKSEGLRQLFKTKTGEFYSDKKIRKSLDKAREVYGSLGYFEFTAYPDLKPHDGEAEAGDGRPAASDGTPAASDGTPAAGDDKPAAGDDKPAASDGKPAPSGGKPAPSGGKPAPSGGKPAARPGPPIVDVTMRMQEGKQYFVNRITFVGNSTTRDNVIRREIRLFEGGVFNTEALKFSIKRLNQLGYFKQLEGGKDLTVDKTPGADNKVDIKLKLEEQNRNQLTFGAGVSQYEGFFGQLSFQTANFMGKGETLTLSLQQGSRARNYQIAFTEPFLFDRPITVGADVFKRQIRYPYVYTEDSTGTNLVFGFQVHDFTRAFMNYSFENIKISDLAPEFTDPAVIAANPYYADSLLLGQNGRRTVSKVTPSIVYNTVDNPIFPNTGRRYTASVDLAGLGGNTSYFKPTLEGVWYFQQSRKTSIGLRGQWQYIKPTRGTVLPIFERLFLGGEYSVRGFDIRSIGPRDPASNLVIGGNTSVLFNAEYLISIAGPVRLVLFYDAGQVQAQDVRLSRTDFKTSTGAEIRFFMPVLNVPFRLIFAWNPQRAGVLDNQLQPQKAFTFRFAVGSTF